MWLGLDQFALCGGDGTIDAFDKNFWENVSDKFSINCTSKASKTGTDEQRINSHKNPEA